jgi:hypothetical protein
MSLKDDILEHKDPDMELEPIPVPEWGNSVYLRKRWNALERDEFERDFGEYFGPDAKPTVNIRARVLVRFMYDESGVRIFADEDAEALAKKSGAAVWRMFRELSSRSSMTEADSEAAKKN